ncbi:MAG: 3-methyl-2-oxobutanoate hydroxymethyltransferase [Candidatus Rokubacteria bacterium]|nr:3-methyl-2-oxobutanoate hydroxymethyltransferase [Candidatus Rokubacteria bacterium]
MAETRPKVTTPDIVARKGRGPKIVQVTCYDFPTAVLVDRAGVDIAMVGDSLAQVALGYDETLNITLDEMLHHVKAVVRARPSALVIADMPFLSYQPSLKTAIRNAGRFLQEGGAAAVKMEGGRASVATIKAVVTAGIPVMGHVGQTPQSIHRFGGFVVRGLRPTEADQILDDALAFQEAGAFAVTLEMMPAFLGKRITETLAIPTISSGAGPHCDGQVLILNDLLGLNFGPVHPSCAKEYVALGEIAVGALSRFADEVRTGVYPEPERWY